VDERLRELWRRAAAPGAPCEDVVAYGTAKVRAGERDVSPLETDLDACRLARELAAAWDAGHRLDVRYREPLYSTPVHALLRGLTEHTKPIAGSDRERWIVAASPWPLMPGREMLPRDSREQAVGNELHARGMDWWVRRGAVVVDSPELASFSCQACRSGFPLELDVAPCCGRPREMKAVLVAVPVAHVAALTTLVPSHGRVRATGGALARRPVVGWHRGVPYQDVVAMSGHPLRQYVILPPELASVRVLTKRGNRWA
jgi:hypothetical protein